MMENISEAYVLSSVTLSKGMSSLSILHSFNHGWRIAKDKVRCMVKMSSHSSRTIFLRCLNDESVTRGNI